MLLIKNWEGRRKSDCKITVGKAGKPGRESRDPWKEEEHSPRAVDGQKGGVFFYKKKTHPPEKAATRG